MFVFYSFDYILRIETMDNDASLVLPLLELGDEAFSRSTANVFNLAHPKTSVLDTFSSLKNKTMNLLLKRYDLDMQLLGYQFDPDTFKATCAIQTGDGSVCC